MNAPITYTPNFIPNPDEAFTRLRNELNWEKRDAPRHEYYCNDYPHPYVYGRGAGRRLYEPRPWHVVIMAIREQLEKLTSAKFEVCFLNRYLNQSDQLGWHADDSPEMDDECPIAVVSLGVEREIWFRQKQIPDARLAELHELLVPDYPWRAQALIDTAKELLAEVERLQSESPDVVEKHLLGHGSLCLMAAGMQDAWQHRIPKASFQCGERISLTFRGYVRPEKTL